MGKKRDTVDAPSFCFFFLYIFLLLDISQRVIRLYIYITFIADDRNPVASK